MLARPLLPAWGGLALAPALAVLCAACAAAPGPGPGRLSAAADTGWGPAATIGAIRWPGAGALGAAIADFLRACPEILRREDVSGLTRPADWAPACADAPGDDPRAFLARHFAPVRLGDGTGLVTGYFEPEVPASRSPAEGLVPVLGGPPPGALPAGPGPTRAEIEAGALRGVAPVLAWADPVDLFFLQVQGSGVLRFADGKTLKLGFGGHNGHGYVAIGRLLRSRGLLPERAGMAEIRAWLAANPAEGAALMRENPRYIFFRPRPSGSSGPVGALGVPLGPMRAIAIDPQHAPLGALALLETEIGGAPWQALVLAADTGAAIRGPNRVDLFTGTGAAAGALAGPLQASGRLVLLLPRAAAARRDATP